MVANSRVRENVRRVAVERGPLVYCLEQPDQSGVGSIFDVSLAVGREPGKEFTAEFKRDLLGGILTLRHKGMVATKPLADEPLYQTFGRTPRRVGREVDLTFIPYYAWANREPTAMEVWVPLQTE